MKRYEELTVYKKQSDGTLEIIRPKYPSRCLSISLRELEEAERQRPGNSPESAPHISREATTPRQDIDRHDLAAKSEGVKHYQPRFAALLLADRI